MSQIQFNRGLQSFLLASLLAPLAAIADPIVIVPIDNGTDGGNVGGFTMTPLDAPNETDSNDAGDDYLCTQSGEICFENRDGDAEGMDASDPSWWQWDHGNVYTSDVSWVELILPENTRAISFWVGASFSGSGWIEALDENNTSTGRVNFGLTPGKTPGFGVYATGQCTSISRVIVDPDNWGIGNLSINRDPCVSVPEPGPLALFGLGLIGLAVSRRFARPVS